MWYHSSELREETTFIQKSLRHIDSTHTMVYSAKLTFHCDDWSSIVCHSLPTSELFLPCSPDGGTIRWPFSPSQLLQANAYQNSKTLSDAGHAVYIMAPTRLVHFDWPIVWGFCDWFRWDNMVQKERDWDHIENGSHARKCPTKVALARNAHFPLTQIPIRILILGSWRWLGCFYVLPGTTSLKNLREFISH